MPKNILVKLLPIFMLLLGIRSIAPYSYLSLDITTFWWIVSVTLLSVFWFNKIIYTEKENLILIRGVSWYLIWMVFNILRGIFVVENYWDWKGLISNAFALLIPIVVYVSTNAKITSYILRCYLRYAFPAFLILFPFMPKGAYGFFLMPFSILLIFLPLISFRRGLVLITVMFVVVLADLSARSNVIKFGLPILLLAIYNFKSFFSNNIKLLEFIRVLLMIVPFVFFTLAISGIFNIFKMQEYLGEHKIEVQSADGEIVQQNLTADTRSDLWEEVLVSAYKHNSWLIGRSPARGNDSKIYGSTLENLTGRKERLANEVAITNIFTWTGIVGVFLYMFIFWRASSLAINKSKNIFSKILGIFVAFRWVYAWIEDRPDFSIGYFILWLTIGMCFSQSFRNMSNGDIKAWLDDVFPDNLLFGRIEEKPILFEKK